MDDEGTSRHALACRLFEEQIREGGRSLGLTPQVVREFLHIVTDPKRFERPLSMDEAIRTAWELWKAREVTRILPSPDVLPRTLDLMATLGLGRKRILDTSLAATLELAGVQRLATFNPGDFAIFPFLEIVSAPTNSGPRLV